MSGTCGFPGCSSATRMAYPGNDPENGAARPTCKAGHSVCERCGRWFTGVGTCDICMDEIEERDEMDAGEQAAAEHEAQECNCESNKCAHHGLNWCPNKAGSKRAIYVGPICDLCADGMPKEYLVK